MASQLGGNSMPHFLVQDEEKLLEMMSYLMLICGIATMLILQFLTAPYGRHARYGFWGPGINARLAWFIQELPCLLVPGYLIFLTQCSKIQQLPNIILLTMFFCHYIQRALIYPNLMRGGTAMPLFPFLLALVFCACNGYLQTQYLLNYASFKENTVYSPHFVVGILLFIAGLLINIHSDHILRNLRQPGEIGYKIPAGGMFTYVSGANFFGECLEWTGFALASWSLPATAFAIFTICNIGPRAIHHHSWYLEKFRDVYPTNRKALVPFVL